MVAVENAEAHTIPIEVGEQQRRVAAALKDIGVA